MKVKEGHGSTSKINSYVFIGITFLALLTKKSNIIYRSFIVAEYNGYNCFIVAQPIGEGNGNPLQYSCMENRMDRGACQAAVHGVAKSRTQLSDFTFIFHFHALEEEMATHTRVLAWRIPGMAGPGGLLSMGSHRVGHD